MKKTSPRRRDRKDRKPLTQAYYPGCIVRHSSNRRYSLCNGDSGKDCTLYP